MSQKIKPFLWFDDKAEEAAKFYVLIDKNSAITGITATAKRAGTGRVGHVAAFTLTGGVRRLNGGPEFKLTTHLPPDRLESQEEVDHLWKDSRERR